MRGGSRASSGPPEGSNATLGDLLYADETVTPAPEEEWAALVRAMAAGDQRALRSLYERTHRIVFTLVLRITSDRQAAEEVTLDVFHDLWRRAASYDAANGSVLGWIMNQARSRAIDRLRFEQRKKRSGRPPDAPEATAADDPQRSLDLREQGRALRGALAVLSANERRAIELAYFSGFTYAEVADRLEEPAGTVKTRIRSGLDKLRRALAGRESEP